jgi:hypothetical protein
MRLLGAASRDHLLKMAEKELISRNGREHSARRTERSALQNCGVAWRKTKLTNSEAASVGRLIQFDFPLFSARDGNTYENGGRGESSVVQS